MAWWKINSHLYPSLAPLARQVMCIPASSADSERLFSQAKLVNSDRRGRLGPSIVSDLIFLKSVLSEGVECGGDDDSDGLDDTDPLCSPASYAAGEGGRR